MSVQEQVKFKIYRDANFRIQFLKNLEVYSKKIRSCKVVTNALSGELFLKISASSKQKYLPHHGF
jgi:hypothetical protein